MLKKFYILSFALFSIIIFTNINNIFATNKFLSGVFDGKDVAKAIVSFNNGQTNYSSWQHELFKNLVIDFNQLETGNCNNFAIIKRNSDGKTYLLLNNGYIDIPLNYRNYGFYLPFIYEILPSNELKKIDKEALFIEDNLIFYFSPNNTKVLGQNTTFVCEFKDLNINKWKIQNNIGVTGSYNSDFSEYDMKIFVMNPSEGDYIEYSYNSDFSSPIFYDKFSSTKTISSKSLKLTENLNIYIRLKSSDGQIKKTFVETIDKINNTIADDFDFDIDYFVGNSIIYITPKLLHNSNFFDIYAKVLKADTVSETIYYNYVKLDNNVQITLTSRANTNVPVLFELREKDTGRVVFLETWNFIIKADGSTGGTIGENNVDLIGIDGNLAGINEKSSFLDIIESVKGTFATFKEFFAILPPFIWVFVAMGLTIAVVLRIFGR